jgi:hypothetical protein
MDLEEGPLRAPVTGFRDEGALSAVSPPHRPFDRIRHMA